MRIIREVRIREGQIIRTILQMHVYAKSEGSVILMQSGMENKETFKMATFWEKNS